jgi:Spy/CpxP family protein refolding chaperone
MRGATVRLTSGVLSQKEEKKMKKLSVCALVLLLVLGTTVAASAQQYGPYDQRFARGANLIDLMRPPSPSEMQFINQQLQLSNDQRSKMQDIYEKYQGQIRDQRQQYQQARQELMSALQEPQPNPGRVEDALRSMHRREREILSSEMDLWGSLTNPLNRQQTEEFWRIFATSRLNIQPGQGFGYSPGQGYYYRNRSFR